MARSATARVTRGLSGWMFSVLPDVVPDEQRTGRDRLYDVAAYLFSFVVATATLVDTWDQIPSWLRPVGIVVGIAAIVSLRWRRTHPAAVGIGIGVVALVI